MISIVARGHRITIYTEEKAKVVALLLGRQIFLQFLAALAILHQDDLKNMMKSPYSSNLPCANHPIPHIVLVQIILFLKTSCCIIASAARNLINSVLQAAVTTFACSSV